MERSTKRVKAKGNYWNEVQEKAVLNYQEESEPVIKNQIFTLYLYPQLYAMSSTILQRYYKTVDDSLVRDSITHVVERAIDKFDPSKAKSYSYFQTVIKHYLYSALGTGAAAQAKARKFESLDTFNDSNILPMELTCTTESWTEEDYRDSVLERLYHLKRGDLKRRSILMVDTLIDLLVREKMLSKEYVTLVLLIALKCDWDTTLRNHARSLGIKLRFTPLDRINRILSRYAKENGISFYSHDLKTIEPWQEIALNKSVVTEELVLESI